MTSSITDAAKIPVSEPTAVITYSPLTLDVPGRLVPLEVKISFPATGGGDLPIILLSHGHGEAMFLSSLKGYAPLTDFWAAHGFVVIQPTHLDSTALGLREFDHSEAPLFWRSRAEDMHFIIDHLDRIEAVVPQLAQRLDHDRVAVAGHSLGGHTASLLLGMRTIDPTDGSEVDLTESRIKAGVILAAPGNGDEYLSQGVSKNYPVLKHTNYSSMNTPALVIAGDRDLNPRFSDRLSYRWDAYTSSPGPKSLLTLYGAEHMLGGISGYDVAETSDANPERVATLRALAWAYLRSSLYSGDSAWEKAVAALENDSSSIGKIEHK